MEHPAFEQKLAWHCAPALMGLKAASLLSLPAAEYPGLATLAGRYNASLRGPRFLVLGHCRKRALLLVYRPELLEEALRHPLARRILADAGYPAEAPLPWLLRRLMDRLKREGEFPHEVGLVLGYPSEDVVGFLTDPDGTGCKLCGCWKVYHDVESAQRRFLQFRRCRDWLLDRLEQGSSLVSLLGGQAA